jgi:hypothetical protein
MLVKRKATLSRKRVTVTATRPAPIVTAPAPQTARPAPAPAPAPTARPAAKGPTDAAAPTSGAQLLRDTFDGPDGLITNSYAFWNKWDDRAIRSSIWETETASLFRKDGAGWTGVPDDVDVDRTSSNGTGAEIFRMWTQRGDFGDVQVDMDLLNEGYTDGSPGWEAHSWDGVKIWLRRQGGSSADTMFYTAEVNRRQGNVIVQKKCSEDDYAFLGQTSTSSTALNARIGQWERVGGTARNNPDGSVTIQVIRDGRVALTVTDRGDVCAPLTAPGKVGIRADNAQFRVDNFTVTALS